MSIQFEWRADLEDLTPEPPSPPPTRPSRRRMLLSASLVLAVLALGLGHRWWQQQQVIAADLRAAASVEVQALIEDDEELFLSLQADESGWLGAQKRVFGAYTARPPWAITPTVPYTYTGQVSKAWGNGLSGWVMVEVTMADQPHQVLWYYQHTPQGWRHAPLDDAALGGRRERAVGPIRLLYRELDEEPASHLATDLQSWLDALTPALGLQATSPFTIELRYDPLFGSSSYSWLNTDRFHLAIVSPSLLPMQLERRPSEVYRQALAWHVVGWLVSQAAGVARPTDLAPEVRGLWADLVAWGMAQLGLSAPAGWSADPATRQVVLQHGPDAVARLVQALGQAETITDVYALAGLPQPDPILYFSLLLGTQQQAVLTGDRKGYWALFDPQAEHDWQVARLTGWPTFDTDIRVGVYPPFDITGLASYFSASSVNPAAFLFSIEDPRVVAVDFHDDRAWVDVEGSPVSDVPTDQRTRRTVFFRREGDRWLYTSPDPAYIGALQQEQAPYLVLRYYQADADQVAGMAPHLSVYRLQAARDFGISDSALMTITVEIRPGWRQGGGGEAVIVYPSPAVDGAELGWALVWELLNPVGSQRLDEAMDQPGAARRAMNNSVARPALFYGIITWEVNQLIPDGTPWLWSYLSPLSREDLSLDLLSEAWREGWTPDDPLRAYLLAIALVHFVIERQGPQVVPAMFDALATADSLDAWLQVVSGQTTAEIEDDWRAWVLERLELGSSP